MAGILERTKLAFIGAGNMAEALVAGLVKGRVCPDDHIVVTDIRPERLEQLHNMFGVLPAFGNREAAAGAGVIVLAVKPQTLPDVLPEIREAFDRDSALVISIAAGITTKKIEDALGEGTKVVRAMPNMPALAGCGAAAICAGRWAGDGELALAEALLGAVGLVVRVAEAQMDAVTAVSGSGPAYVFLLIEAMIEAAKSLGLGEAEARKLVVATVGGAARLCEVSGESPAVLRERVTSRGGTTEAALKVLAGRGVYDGMLEAIEAACRRSKELSGR